MTDQTPAEMRGFAFDLRLTADVMVRHQQLGSSEIRAMRAGADALDRLDRAREVYQMWCDQTVDNCSDEMEMLLADISEALFEEVRDDA